MMKDELQKNELNKGRASIYINLYFRGLHHRHHSFFTG